MNAGKPLRGKNKISYLKTTGISILFVSMSIMLLGSFNSPQQSGYGPWQATSCYRKIDFCVKRGAYSRIVKKYEWYIKFRNRYHETIFFSFALTESNVKSARTIDRMSIAPGEEKSTWFFVADAKSVNVFVNKLRFGDDDFYAKYVRCDN